MLFSLAQKLIKKRDKTGLRRAVPCLLAHPVQLNPADHYPKIEVAAANNIGIFVVTYSPSFAQAVAKQG